MRCGTREAVPTAHQKRIGTKQNTNCSPGLRPEELSIKCLESTRLMWREVE